MDTALAIQGYYVYPLQIILPATLNAIVQSQIQLLQGVDFKVVSIQTMQTGNWSVEWGTNTTWWMTNYVRYQNAFGTGILPHRYIGPGFDYCPIFPRGSVIVFSARNDTGNGNTIDIAIEGIYGNFIS